MLIIRYPAELARARLPTLLYALATTHLRRVHEGNLHYDPQTDGHIAIVTDTDTDLSLGQHLGQRWCESLFEGVTYDRQHRCFTTVVLHGNQYAVSILIPDEPWLDPMIRNRLLAEIDDRQPLPPYLLG